MEENTAGKQKKGRGRGWMMVKKRMGKCNDITGGQEGLAADDTSSRKMNNRFERL